MRIIIAGEEKTVGKWLFGNSELLTRGEEEWRELGDAPRKDDETNSGNEGGRNNNGETLERPLEGR